MSLGVDGESETLPMRSYVRCRLEEKLWLTSKQERNILSSERELFFIYHSEIQTTINLLNIFIV